MSSVSAAAAAKDCAVEFTGTKSGYFKLWFVNLLLSILTLGIYSAWAKVRNNQYLYGHTQVDGHRLSYLAQPLQILRGRILAIVVFGGLYLVGTLMPLLLAVFFIGYIFLLPWLIGQGLRFTLRMTAYRNVRFSFTGSYGDLFVHFVLLPMVAVFTMYLTAPWIHKQIIEFMHKSITYGGKPMKVSLRTGRFYWAAFCALGSFLILSLTLGFLVGAGVGISALEDEIPGFVQNGAVLLFPLVYLGMAFVAGVYAAIVRNHLLESLRIDELVSFRSNLDVVGYSWLLATNLLLLIVTLGLAFPITRVRKIRYLCEHTRVFLTPAINDIHNTVDEQHSAFGEEAAGLFDTDFSVAG
ncbi:hypothetical protein CHH28_06575 [Bacterioplanes sanyensis]|uniref:Uncharacterized protein n=1 Tax=Bacterioplanes sanyensis TaxID=1249553 RepID=A0A222FJF9_9GAMM|nr:YjgN family protein [Bacterioplanes sanyensis]ASP38363.1 hypothetical protein CHH28_06575 [Bacterioplanes sanyensis]